MNSETPMGTKRTIDGRERVYYYGYWIKAYEVPADTLLGKKRLIQALTRRLFNHVEHGLNVPGTRLEEARRSYEAETDPARRRVRGGMLAGALFNRAADVFTKMVELQELGVEIHHDNSLMRQCGEHLQEALALGKMVLHRSGEEGIDELWGEPFKAFAFSIEDFYKSRYVKIALTMRDMDQISEKLGSTFDGVAAFHGVGPLVQDFVRSAKSKCETLRTDDDIFDVSTSFAVSSQNLLAFVPVPADALDPEAQAAVKDGVALLEQAVSLVSWVARARVPMPKSTREYGDRCDAYRAQHARAAVSTRSVA